MTGCEAAVCGVEALRRPGGPVQVPFRACCVAALVTEVPEPVQSEASAEVVVLR